MPPPLEAFLHDMGRGPCAGSLCAMLFCTALAGEAPCALSPEELPLAARTACATAHCDIVLFSAAYFGADAALDLSLIHI